MRDFIAALHRVVNSNLREENMSNDDYLYMTIEKPDGAIKLYHGMGHKKPEHGEDLKTIGSEWCINDEKPRKSSFGVFHLERIANEVKTCKEFIERADR